MSDKPSSKTQKENSDHPTTTPTASGGYQTPIDSDIRKTGDAEKSDARPTATPEAPGEDTVAGSPNQGTPSR
ncbi:hypothetical protein VB711_18580 [Cronbergia sp. UHCC 0137]|uniref:hypothetical protein n=1 Tax=Cronbergia sp. UHCC 0137 TaxID=3110239 RepID=UPI002B21B7E7|nr:hypothetical protein [Cronbergia sp. UHCC 0137]MEA5619834.1 hypothetical protein [Cronbergia sp. UHCC 0137]